MLMKYILARADEMITLNGESNAGKAAKQEQIELITDRYGVL